jgi:hypothetical protein
MKKLVIVLVCVLACLMLLGCPRYSPPKNQPNTSTNTSVNTTNPPANSTNTTPPVQTCVPGWLCNESAKYYLNADCSRTDNAVCENGCSNGSCIVLQNPDNNATSCTGNNCTGSSVKKYYCDETDDERDYVTAGTVNYSASVDGVITSSEASDTCLNESYLREYYCASNYTIASEEFVCTYACINGACTLSPPCATAWVCNGSLAYYRNRDCSADNETICEFECQDGVCQPESTGGHGGSNPPPVNDTQPPANDTQPPTNDTEPPANDTAPPEEPPADGGGPQDGLII